MKASSSNVRNSSFVSIWKAPARKYATDASKDEKVQQPILNIEALRTIGRIVRAIQERIEDGQRSEIGSDPARAGDNSGSGAASQDRSQDYGRGEEQNK